MKIAYFDCFSGISGDMVLGALLDAGFPFEVLLTELKKLPLKDYEIKAEKVEKLGISATKVCVRAEEKGIIRTWSNVKSIIQESKLHPDVKEESQRIFLKLAEAESKTHRKSIDQVHFHEIGAHDTLIDIVGTVIGLHYLGIKEIYSSPLATGMGLMKTEHGVLPIPAPATLEILKDIPIYSAGIATELVTPTGAAIIKTYAKEFGEMPPLKIASIGYGAGTRDLKIPNVLRILVGEALSIGEEMDLVETIRANIDDMNPEVYHHVMERLFEAGALDVWLTPIYMKRNRPGVTLSVLLPLRIEEKILEILFEETTTLGIRCSRETRRKLTREILEIDTEFGPIAIKMGKFRGRIVNISPEYEDCARIARESNVPLKLVYEKAKEAAREELKKRGET
ncbi:MAG: nickel pincer cofactor biosynthesis protein LarC [Actinomycetota bacterium]|nr:nickel pincer cofactor biosynthesis protein LarC [Actinomycetota bacterium]